MNGILTAEEMVETIQKNAAILPTDLSVGYLFSLINCSTDISRSTDFSLYESRWHPKILYS